MNAGDISQRQRDVLERLHSLPVKILSLHEHECLSDMVLHDLCGPSCFNLKKAAYLVDNPDFDCSRGVAGFSADEQYQGMANMWEEPHEFAQYARSARFNQKVRALHYVSITKHNTDYIVQQLARDLGIVDPFFYTWGAKHGNHGVVIGERQGMGEDEASKYLQHGLGLLGFCPLV
jgi:hypothetical protein